MWYHSIVILFIALGKVSRDAMVSMIKVKQHVDQQLINLPSHKQAKQVIENANGIIDETRELIKALAKQNQVLEKEIEDAKKAVQEGEAGKISSFCTYKGPCSN